MAKNDKVDKFGHPIDTSTPIVMTEEEAKARMAEVAAEEAESIEDLAARLQPDDDVDEDDIDDDDVGDLSDLDGLEELIGRSEKEA